MPHTIHHGGYPLDSVAYNPRSIKRQGAVIRYIAAGNVIWLLKPDIEAHYAQIKRHNNDGRPELALQTPKC